MKRLNLIIGMLAFVYSFKTQAQDGIFWGHNITFNFENIWTNDKNDSLISVEFFTNTEYLSTKCHGSEIKSEKEGQYVLAYSCSAIGGANAVNKIKCPDVYLKFEIALNKNEKKKVTRLIPFVFEMVEGSYQKIIIPKIDVYNIFTKKVPVVLIDAMGNYKIVEQQTMDNRLFMFNLEIFKKQFEK